jgi:hypothetical protein
LGAGPSEIVKRPDYHHRAFGNGKSTKSGLVFIVGFSADAFVNIVIAVCQKNIPFKKIVQNHTVKL